MQCKRFVSVLILVQVIFFAGTIVSFGQTKWSLQQCIDRALEKNITINQSKLGNDINRLTLEQSKANRVPSLNFNDGQNFSYGRSIDPFSNQYVNQNVSSNNVSLNSSVTLFNGLQNENVIRQNQLNYDAGKTDIEVARNDVSLNVVAAYLQILLAYDQVDIAKNQVTASLAQVDRAKKYVDVGKFPESNLLQVQSQLASDNYTKVTAENQLRNSKVALMQLIELPVSDTFEIDRPDVSLLLQQPAQSAEQIYSTALGILPQVTGATYKTQSAAFGLKIARGLQMPKLTLGAGLKTGYSSASNVLSYQSQVTQEQIGYLQSNPSAIVLGPVASNTVLRQDYPFSDQFKDNFSQFVNLSLLVPIFNNKQAKTSIEKAKVNAKIADLNEQSVKNQLRKSIEQAVTDANGAEKKYAAAKEQVLAEEATYTNLEKKFSLGMISSTDLILEKNNYAKAKANEIQAKYEYVFRIKIVDYYLGKSLTF